MSDKIVVVSLDHPHATHAWLILQRCIVDVDRLSSGPKVIASESEKGRKTFLCNHEFSDAETEIIL